MAKANAVVLFQRSGGKELLADFMVSTHTIQSFSPSAVSHHGEITNQLQRFALLSFGINKNGLLSRDFARGAKVIGLQGKVLRVCLQPSRVCMCF